MDKFVLLGGTQKENIDTKNYQEWKGFSKGIAIEFNADTLNFTQVIDYITPKENRVESTDASILFKAGEITNNWLITCTQTEILIFDKDTYKLIKCISLRSFNDVHHVCMRKNGNFAVVSSGLDAVFEIDQEGNCINEYPVGDFSLWEKYDNNTDYRKILTTKPHTHHPNFCFEYNEELWVTRFWDKDALNLNTGATLSIDAGNPHDGRVIGDHAFFTTVNGFIVKIHIPTGEQETLDLNPFNDSEKVLGWCRSIEILDNNRFIIGFSRMRTSKYKNYLQWIKRRIKSDAFPGNQPTRIAIYNFSENKLEVEFNLEDLGMNAIFSILKI